MALIPFIFPINVYLIGDSFGAGLLFLLIRIQETTLGWSTIFIWQEFCYVADGIISGRSASSILLWLGGVVLLAVAAILILTSRESGKRGVIVYGLGWTLLVASTMIQYGPLFHGPAGIAIPIGLPLLIVLGYLLWKDATRVDLMEEHDDSLPAPDDASGAAPLAASGSAEAIADD
jgi:hypothetical protein